MEEFLKELTELSLKHKLVLAGDGVYYCIRADKTTDNLKGKYIFSHADPQDDLSRIEWSDNV